MALSIELKGKIVEIPGDDREIIKIVGGQLRQSKGDYTIVEITDKYKEYFVKSLQGTCPICEHETNHEDNYCGICGSKVAHLPKQGKEGSNENNCSR